MTETACPTCGAKCVSNPKYRDDYSALPPPDLTKLREVIKEHGDHAGRYMRNIAYPIIVQTVKELLEGDK